MAGWGVQAAGQPQQGGPDTDMLLVGQARDLGLWYTEGLKQAGVLTQDFLLGWRGRGVGGIHNQACITQVCWIGEEEGGRWKFLHRVAGGVAHICRALCVMCGKLTMPEVWWWVVRGAPQAGRRWRQTQDWWRGLEALGRSSGVGGTAVVSWQTCSATAGCVWASHGRRGGRGR